MIYGDESILYFPTEYYAYARAAGHNPNFAGAKIYGETLALFFHNVKYTINISSIEAIMHQKNALHAKNRLFFFYIRNEDKTLRLGFSEYLFNIVTFQALVRKLKQMNPAITLDSDVGAILESSYEYSETIHFDFTVHKAGKQSHFIVNSLKTRLRATWIYLFTAFLCIAGLPYICRSVLLGMYGNWFDFYRLGLCTLAGCSLAVVCINFFVALRSKYRGHLLTFGCLLLAVVLVILAFV